MPTTQTHSIKANYIHFLFTTFNPSQFSSELAQGQATSGIFTFMAQDKFLSYICFMPNIETIKDTLHKLKPELSKKFHVAKIGLFGSIVRSDFSPEKSDIDILVDFSSPIGIEFIDLADFLEAHIHHKIDLVSKKGVKEAYMKEIESEIIYV
jgi:predicted nucleotidyltransferase